MISISGELSIITLFLHIKHSPPGECFEKGENNYTVLTSHSVLWGQRTGGQNNLFGIKKSHKCLIVYLISPLPKEYSDIYIILCSISTKTKYFFLWKYFPSPAPALLGLESQIWSDRWFLLVTSQHHSSFLIACREHIYTDLPQILIPTLQLMDTILSLTLTSW